MYKYLHSKNFEESGLDITIALLPSLKDLEVLVYYHDVKPQTFGTEIETVITFDEKFLRTISPLTSDYLAVLIKNELSIYITDYTNSDIHINELIDERINYEYRKVQEEYINIRKSDIRLFRIQYDSVWLEEVQTETVTKIVPCLLDKSFESPKLNGYVFGNLKKTIIDKNNNYIDIIEPISVYIRYEINNFSTPLSINNKDIEDVLISILRVLTNQALDYTTLYRIFYHYAKNNETLMKIYNDKILKINNQVSEHMDTVLAMFKEDALKAFKMGVDEIAKIYAIIATPQPINKIPYCINISDFKMSKKFNSTDNVKLYYINNEISYEKVGNLNPQYCQNYNIIFKNGKYKFIKR